MTDEEYLAEIERRDESIRSLRTLDETTRHAHNANLVELLECRARHHDIVRALDGIVLNFVNLNRTDILRAIGRVADSMRATR